MLLLGMGTYVTALMGMTVVPWWVRLSVLSVMGNLLVPDVEPRPEDPTMTSLGLQSHIVSRSKCLSSNNLVMLDKSQKSPHQGVKLGHVVLRLQSNQS